MLPRKTVSVLREFWLRSSNGRRMGYYWVGLGLQIVRAEKKTSLEGRRDGS